LITGDEKSGKSWMAGKLCEQLILHGYSLCVVDPGGDYRTLEAMPGVTVLGGDDPLPTPRELLRALQFPDRSVIIDLSRSTREETVDYVQFVLTTLNVLRRRTGLPHKIVVDEAHRFLQGTDGRDLLDLDFNGYVVVTYRASVLPAPLVAATEVMLVTCESDPAEIEHLRARCAGCHGVPPEAWAALGRLAVGRAAALPITEEAEGLLRPFWMGRRLTPHVRHREKYLDVPVPVSRAFRFHANGGMQEVQTLGALVAVLEKSDPRRMEGYLRRSDFSRWIAEAFGDRGLAGELRTLEHRYGGAEPRGALDEIVAAIRSRYDLAGEEQPTKPAPRSSQG
jgi:hypothetical protein